jgi:hypothetical protein
MAIAARGTSKDRLLAQLDQISRTIERFPEPVCYLLERSAVVANVMRYVGTAGNVTEVTGPLVDAVDSLARAVRATVRNVKPARTVNPRARRRIT